MNTIWAIRELCAGEDGFKNLFDRDKSYGKLIDLSDNKKEASLVATMLYGRARRTLLAMVHDAYNYDKYARRAIKEIALSGMSGIEARHTLDIFLEAFGFPDHRSIDPSKADTIVTDDGSFRTEYKGEVRNGKEHGVGVRTCYYDGKWCNYDECVWIDGVMCGYNNSKELQFEMFEDRKIGFVVNDNFIGKSRTIASGGEEFDEEGKNLDI